MLPEERRKQLDGIVGQMTANRENDDAISFVVNDFKNKYGVEEPEERFSEKAAKVLDTIFGGGRVGEAIGAQIAKAKATPLEKTFIESPTAGQVVGSALQSASLFAPVGTVAKGITGGARAIGMVKGASALGKIGSGALAGELFDVATNLQNGKTGKEALTPGLGALLGGGLPAVGVAKNVIVRMGERQAPRVINSLIKPLAKDFSYGKNPGRAIAEEGIIANDFDELLTGIRASREKVGKEIGEMSAQFSTQPIIDISKTLSPLDDAIKTAVSQNNQGLVTRLNNSRRAIAEVLEPTMDDMGNIGIKSAGGRNLTNLTFKQVRNILGEIGDMTQFTGNPSDDKLVNSALKGVYGKIKGESLKYARELNPEAAKGFEKLTEKYADLSSAEIATRYRDKIVERQALIGLSPQTAGIGAGIITAVATGGATLPSVVVGASAALLDKLASTPGFKTRLAFLLSKKSTNEVNYLFRKVPALKRFFSLKEGVSPGDVILGNRAEGVEKGITGYIKNPKLGLSIEDVTRRDNGMITRNTERYNPAPVKATSQYEDQIQAITKEMQKKNMGIAAVSPERAANRLRDEFKELVGRLRDREDMTWQDRRVAYQKFFDDKKAAISTPDDIFKPIKDATPAVGLSAEERLVENKAFAKLDANPQKALDDYNKIPEAEGGKVVNTDLARRIFKDEGYVGSNSRAVQEPSSALAKVAFQQGLKNKGDVVLTAGGSGTGKSSAIGSLMKEDLSKAAVILDGNLSSMKSALARIKEANDSGKVAHIVYVYREPLDSWVNGVVKRMTNNVAEGGRAVPASVVAENHIGSYNVVKELLNMQRLGKLKNVRFDFIDNSLGAGKQQLMDFEKFVSLKYPSVDELKEIFIKNIDAKLKPEQIKGLSQ